MTWRVFVAVLAAFVSACNSAPTVPTTAYAAPSPNTVTAPTVSNAAWRVAVQTIANAGPDFCIWTPSVGCTFTGDYTVSRNGSTVSFVPSDASSWDTFTASLDGANFTASIGPVSSGSGMCTHYTQAVRFSGSFAPDNDSFTATETLTLTLDSGQMKTLTFSWVGTRR